MKIGMRQTIYSNIPGSRVVTALIKYDRDIAELSNIVVTGKGFDLYHFSKCPISK